MPKLGMTTNIKTSTLYSTQLILTKTCEQVSAVCRA